MKSRAGVTKIPPKITARRNVLCLLEKGDEHNVTGDGAL